MSIKINTLRYKLIFFSYFKSPYTQIILKIYQASIIAALIYYTYDHYQTFNDTFLLFTWFYVLLYIPLCMMQLNNAVLNPFKSQDLASALVVIIAQVNIEDKSGF